MITVAPVINIIGYGFVGGAMGELCRRNNLDYNVYDVMSEDEMNNKKKNTDDTAQFKYFTSLVDLVNNSENNDTTLPSNNTVVKGTLPSNNTVVKGTFKEQVNFYFICVPTPSDSEGNCDISLVERVIKDLNHIIKKRSVIIIKSTVKPGTTRILAENYNNKKVDIVFCPEFLRELTYKQDIYSTNFALFGINTNERDTQVRNLQYNLINLFTNYLYKHKLPPKEPAKPSFWKQINIFSKKQPRHPPQLFECHIKSYEECEIFKYTVNVFLAVKVWYFNEIYTLCEKFSVNYNSFRKLLPLDERIGMSHTQVPGYHGFGFSGKCLPKETVAMKKLQEDLNIPSSVLDEILKRNDFFNNK